MIDVVKQALGKEDQPEIIKQLTADTVALVKKSRDDMKEYHPRWDANYDAYRGWMKENDADKKAAEREEPRRMVIPILYSQVTAFVAYIMSLYRDKKTFFELEPQGEEDTKTYRLAELLLDQNLRYNRWGLQRYQVLLDIAVFGVGCVKLSWETKKRRKREMTEPSVEIVDGIEVPVPPMENVREEIIYNGNILRVISPYRIFPDTRMPLARYEEGEFFATYDQFTKVALRRKEADEQYFVGTKYIKNIEMHEMSDWKSMRLDMFNSVSADSYRVPTSMVATMHCQRWLVPSEYEINGDTIGPEDYPCLYDIWIANDKRMIRLEKSQQAFDRWSYFLGQYDADLNDIVPDSLAGRISELQATASWLINSRIASVRKTIQNWIVVDENKVHMEDIVERRPVIRLKQQGRSGGVEAAVKQLDVRDQTQSHISDANVIIDFVKIVSGVTDNLMGMFSGGRRSAKEAQQVYQSAAARLELVAANIHEQLFIGLGEGMLDNCAEFCDIPTLVRIRGEEHHITPELLKLSLTGQQPAYEDVYMFHVNRGNIQGKYDFKFVNTHAPSQKAILGSILAEVFDRLAQNPQAAIMANLDPGKLIRELLKLNGETNLNQYSFEPEQLARALGLIQSGTEQPAGGAEGEPTSGQPTPRPAPAIAA